MAVLLSAYQRKDGLCRKPHNLETDTTSRSDAANPPSSLQVDEDNSKGPSTGPAPVERTVFLVKRTQP